MERSKGYRDKDIEIDLNDVSSRLDQAIELKAKVKDDRKKDIQKIIEDTRVEKDILKKHIENYQKKENNIRFADFLKYDKRYQQMKNRDIEVLKEAHLKINLEQVKEAKKITDRAKERQIELDKLKRSRDNSKELNRGR